MALIEGKKMILGGTEYVVPPFPVKVLRTHPEWVQSVREIADIPTPEQQTAMVGLIHSAMVRNYPDLTPEAVEDALDIRTMLEALAAVMDMSGFIPATPGADKGEAQPGS